MLTSLVKNSNLGRISVIWLGKNAARTDLPLAWFARLQPLSILVSAPSAQSIKLLEQWDKATILDTQRHGWVQLSSDGEAIWVESQKLYGD